MLGVAAIAVVSSLLVARSSTDRVVEPSGSTAVDRTPSLEPSVAVVPVSRSRVRIDKVSSESGASRIGRVAGNVIDGRLDTFWSIEPTDRDRRIRFRFDPAVELVRLEFVNGAAGDEYLRRPRFRSMELIFSDGSSQRALLADTRNTQSIKIDPPSTVSWVEVHFLSDGYSATKRATAPQGQSRASLSEVRFFMAATS